MRKKDTLAFVMIALVLIFFIYIVVYRNKSTPLRRECPDEWIENRMPGPTDDSASQYFIIDGQRKEINDFDIDWIKENCSVQIHYVY